MIDYYELIGLAFLIKKAHDDEYSPKVYRHSGEICDVLVEIECNGGTIMIASERVDGSSGIWQDSHMIRVEGDIEIWRITLPHFVLTNYLYFIRFVSIPKNITLTDQTPGERWCPRSGNADQRENDLVVLKMRYPGANEIFDRLEQKTY
jgi:hypothetical protein